MKRWRSSGAWATGSARRRPLDTSESWPQHGRITRGGPELFEESLGIVRELDWQWWECYMLSNLAAGSRRLNRLDTADRYAREAFPTAGELGDRMSSVFTAAEVASVAALRGDVAAAGRIWGAIEAEEELGPVGQWPAQRREYEAIVLAAASSELAESRAQGRLLSLAEAVGRGGAPPEPVNLDQG